ncbi:MAG TPA: prolyl oligopeptidase family serine peptidase, partial [Fimbriimonas sp.]|nr:prolyl oligopeptidase family serine peptidase [Fimbriimonas sp.]
DAALTDGLKQPGVDGSRVLATGHSEGGIVVARLAAQNSKVTDVAPLAGGGPSQLVDLEKLIGKEHAAKMWADVQSDPMSTTKFVWGHPHRRWSTFLASSTLEEATKSKARFFIAQGTKDTSVDPDSAIVLHDGLKKLDRDVTLLMIEGGDHGFSTDPNDRTGKGFIDVFDKVRDWFLK